MSEPVNPDKFYVFEGTIEVDGKKGYGKVKKWYDEEEKKFKERVIAFEGADYD